MPETPQIPQNIDPGQVQQALQERGLDLDTLQQQLLPTSDFRWFLPFILIFVVIFFRRWQFIRMGFWFVVVVILSARVTNPQDYFWYAFAGFSGAFSWVMSVLQTMVGVKSHKNEPLFYALNAIPLTVFFMAVRAGPESSQVPIFISAPCYICAFASVFFTKPPKSRIQQKRGSYVPDDAMIKSLTSKNEYRL